MLPAQESKFKVESVEIQGNRVFSDDKILSVMVTRPSWFLDSHYYHAQIFKDDLESIKLLYENNGYLQAEIKDWNVQIDSAKKEAHIHISVEEGELTRIEGISIFGNSVFSDERLLKLINMKNGDPFKKQMVEEIELGILTLYANNGYLDAKIKTDIRTNDERHLALIDFMITENQQFKIDQILYKGLEKTDKYVVTRELLFREGDIVQYSKLLESQRRLYLMGLFQSVFIKPRAATSADSTKKDILIEVKEKVYGEFNVSVGYGSVEQVRGGLEVQTTNLAGTARKIGFSAQASFINRGGGFSYSQPWTFGFRWRTDFNAKYDYNIQPGFDYRLLGGVIVVGRDFIKNSRISVSYRYEDSDFKHVKITPLPQKLKTNVRSLTLSLVYDRRNNLFNATRGMYFEWNTEMAGSFLFGTNTFARSIWDIKYFHPWKNRIVLGTALEVGWMDLFGGSQEIPLNERFYTGGPNSLRGFDYQKLGPRDSTGVPRGGKLKVVWNVFEIRHPIFKFIRGAIFTDAGNVWAEPEFFNIIDIRVSFGYGLRLDTPIGIGRLDFSINPKPRNHEPQWKFYFSLGQAF